MFNLVLWVGLQICRKTFFYHRMWTLPVLVPFIRFWYLSDVAESKILSARGSWRMCGFCWVPTRKHWTLRVPHANAWLTNMGTVRLVRQHLSAQVEIQCDYSQYKLNCLETLAQQGMKHQMLSWWKFGISNHRNFTQNFKWGPKPPSSGAQKPQSTMHISFLDVVLIENPWVLSIAMLGS